MVFSGPLGGTRSSLADEAARAAAGRGPAIPIRQRKEDPLGMSVRAAAGQSGPKVSPGPDPKQLSTNRGEEQRGRTPVSVEKEPGRNDPCPCGSGKKYKKCCYGRV